jgi:hypothetical protein
LNTAPEEIDKRDNTGGTQKSIEEGFEKPGGPESVLDKRIVGIVSSNRNRIRL